MPFATAPDTVSLSGSQPESCCFTGEQLCFQQWPEQWLTDDEDMDCSFLLEQSAFDAMPLPIVYQPVAAAATKICTSELQQQKPWANIKCEQPAALLPVLDDNVLAGVVPHAATAGLPVAQFLLPPPCTGKQRPGPFKPQNALVAAQSPPSEVGTLSSLQCTRLQQTVFSMFKHLVSTALDTPFCMLSP